MLLKLWARFTKPYTLLVAGVVVFQLMSTMATLYLPSLNAKIIDQGVAHGDTDYIWRTGGWMLAVAFGQVVAAVIAVYLGSKTSMALGRDIRQAVFRKVSSFSAKEVNEFGAATLITRGTNDVQQVQMVTLMGLNFMVMTPIMCIGGIVMALREDLSLSWLVWVSVAVLLVVVGGLVWMLMPLFRAMQGKLDTVNGVLREQITGMRVVRAFTREPFETDRFTAANKDITQVSIKIGNLFVLMFPIIMVLLHLATASVLWFGGHRVDQGNMQVGSLTAFLQYLLQILTAVMMGTFMAMMIPRASIAADRIGEVLAVEPSMRPTESSALPAEQATGVVDFQNVTFAYPGAEAPVLANLTFSARPGETTAIIGSTGAGKTTLLSLLPRLHDADAGRVTIDGVPVQEIGREDLKKIVSLVPQKPYLFSGTIASNLRFGQQDATDEQLWQALETAQGADFVRAKAKGLDEPISQGGTNVSGGQRQRLCIARTLVMKPSVYLFDDSFSALDVATDARLRRALAATTKDATVIIVAQRVSSIRDADQIIVLDKGQIVGRGTHTELLATNPTYQEIVESQMSAEEAA
jgi:ATP-binding cassette subfamily B protein